MKFVLRVAKLQVLCKYITLIEIKMYKEENRKQGCSLSSEKPEVKGNIKPSKMVAGMVKNLPAMQETHVRSLSQEDPLEKGMAIHSNIFAWIIHQQRSLVGYSSWGHKE